jgi:hypothetical protein
VIKAFINPPPDIFKNFDEVSGDVRRGWHSTTESRVNMMMPAAKGTGDKSALAVNNPVAFLQFATCGKSMYQPNFPVNAFFHYEMGRGWSESLRVYIPGVFKIECHTLLLLFFYDWFKG